VEKAERVEIRRDTRIRTNDVLKGVLLVEHLDRKRRGRSYFAVPLPFP
jgi:hypothetical protein